MHEKGPEGIRILMHARDYDLAIGEAYVILVLSLSLSLFLGVF